VTASRQHGNPSANILKVWVNDQFLSYSGAQVDDLNLDPPANNRPPFRVGEQCPDFSMFQGHSFDGAVDELQIYKCCLSDAEVGTLYNHPCIPCRESLYVPYVVSMNSLAFPWGQVCMGPCWVSSTFQICNYSGSDVTYKWTAAGLPATTACGTVPGPTIFSPYNGSVTVPKFTCTPVTVWIQYPSGFIGSDAACYQITIKNMTTLNCKSAQGTIVQTPLLFTAGCCPMLPATLSTDVPVSFGVRNTSGVTQSLPVELSTVSSSGDQSDPVVSINGMAPGTSWTSVLVLAPGDSATVRATARFTDFQGLHPTDVVLSVDWNHSGTYVPSAVQGLECVAEKREQPASVPSAPPALLAPLAPGDGSALTISPNPFRDGTGIHFQLGSSQGLVRISVFDVGGRLVREIFSGSLTAGSHEYQWDGRNEQGLKSPGGIYFIRLQIPGTTLKNKVVRME
jgi:hypothetical protein